MNKIEEAERGRHFFEKLQDAGRGSPHIARGEMHTGLQITREEIIRWGAEKGWTNNPRGSGRA